jgi:hypothetical protein
MGRKFDVVVGNPPFQNSVKRGKTQHKLWKPATFVAMELLKENGYLTWISPTSWGSPSNKILNIIKNNNVLEIDFDIENYFDGVGSTFCYYTLIKQNPSTLTSILKGGKKFKTLIDNDYVYVPNDLSPLSSSIHQKIIFNTPNFYEIGYDYVTCHNNIILQAQRKGHHSTLSHIKKDNYIYPVFHTNNKIWYSEFLQDFAHKPKVMWSRSGYVKPFYNDNLGGTDMAYFILVGNETEGKILVSNLETKLFKYIFATAKWSGFNDEKLFKMLPELPATALSDIEMMSYFGLTDDEINHIEKYFEPRCSKSAKRTKKIVKSKKRTAEFGEVFTPPALISKMLEGLPQRLFTENASFIDPFCGNGNFLVEIMERKIAMGVPPQKAMDKTYGVDISRDNLVEAKKRMHKFAAKCGTLWCEDMLKEKP